MPAIDPTVKAQQDEGILPSLMLKFKEKSWKIYQLVQVAFHPPQQYQMLQFRQMKKALLVLILRSKHPSHLWVIKTLHTSRMM